MLGRAVPRPERFHHICPALGLVVFSLRDLVLFQHAHRDDEDRLPEVADVGLAPEGLGRFNGVANSGAWIRCRASRLLACSPRPVHRPDRVLDS